MPNDIEHRHQVQYFKHVRYFRDLPGFEDLNSVCAIPNGGHRVDRVAMKLSEEGVEPGVWDVLVGVPVPQDSSTWWYSGMWIEFKAPGRENEGNGRGVNKVVNGGLSDYQLAFATQQAERGNFLFVAYTWEQAWTMTKKYLGLTELIAGNPTLRNKELLLCSI